MNANLKEYTTDDRLRHTLVQQHDSLVARKRIEHIRLQTSQEQLAPLIDENFRLQMHSEQLHQQSTKIYPKKFHELEEQIAQLKDIHRVCWQEHIHDQSHRKDLQNLDEYLQRKTNRLTLRMRKILQKFQENHRFSQENFQHLQILDRQLNEQERVYLEENSHFKQTRMHLERQHSRRIRLEKQLEIASNNIQ